MADIEGMADQIFGAIEAYLERRVGPLRAEINQLRAALAESNGRFDELRGGPLTSVERRLSRHADHLSSLESKVKKLELDK